ncbi:MAG: 1-acyl-sn-glycerol-3-phosphate acyltransferase [Clostridia bacterium]|nr:1-acyl-sn-glycerol-3-phosphate acyltransferase [Clostridia bacterium]
MFYKFAREIVRAFFYIFIGKPKIIAKENLAEAESGSVILCANHLSNWDPVILAMIYKRHIAFMAKEALFTNPIFAKVMYTAGMFPVSRDGNDIKAIKNALAVLKNNETLGIFTEGRRYFDGEVHELKD